METNLQAALDFSRRMVEARKKPIIKAKSTIEQDEEIIKAVGEAMELKNDIKETELLSIKLKKTINEKQSI